MKGQVQDTKQETVRRDALPANGAGGAECTYLLQQAVGTIGVLRCFGC